MKTLLIDNYDSYTYNLFQLIAEVNGEEPVVVLNDAPVGDIPELREFDNVVVSPGPGHPLEPRDFGIAARVIAEAGIPVLGVCLGHQGIAVGERADVEPAPWPRHGHLSTVRHDGRDLFRGLPQNFTVVRYHSLSVREPLPPTLEATAWSEDGVLMGLRHRERPLWGVQFHPESILTDHGHRLLVNFRDLTEERAGSPRTQNTAVIPLNGAIPRPRRPSAPAYRLHTRRIAGAVDAEAAFTRMYADSRHAFWLDSSRVEPGLSRFSFFGDGSGPLAEVVRYDVDSGLCEIEREGRPTRRVQASVFDYLKRQLASRKVDATGLPFDFTGGYVGYFGYELKADTGSPNRHKAETPDATWLFADRLIAVDHEEGHTYAVCLSEDTPAASREAGDWLDTALAQLTFVGSDATVPLRPATPPYPRAAEPWLVRDRATYLADIEACKAELNAGTSYEVCLTDAVRLPAPYDPYDFYRVLRRINPAPYAAFLRFGDLDIAGSSPERFLRITRDGIAEAKPIKGTAPRGGTPQEDARLRDELAADAKTRAENLMIVDLLRNDLGRVSRTGSVKVTRLMATETYATVHQLVSTVEGRLREGTDAVDCIRACFPGGSMTGAPKLRTMEIIDSLETEARGVYSGALGYLGCSGGADLDIVIRTAVFQGGRMHLGAGGAIVLDSDPAAEYDEMLLKTAALMRAHREHASAPAVTEEPTR
ncbi:MULTISPECIES: aminodeoxychorismate synthase component I [Streptomyces]|uniref:aminodeoxychorismate synthase component I n=1 Tax=Streptomyces TaxID=1883 RepID=UPI000A3B5E16|nr:MULTISPECIES: aminodeoxychorismate synthase component I [Streptomyces]MDX3580857.1 aminodeoxychorismate synthase component I [Streptomyces europaeiscabiei]MDX3615851.1 aminodeoxychorismate synthase component I [Streptomyces europaeiscabiei]MDX3630968.1 aminodeoxychorismate synthase component I [Streptomyces europaeiscabiei]MDX3649018.1 aminodeoxychorismate synthase component I [Streptomyces europaeiscabiei]WUD37447.1 aminodeoxychorismate synthase component I [Streptomyces europaeiscabiei]